MVLPKQDRNCGAAALPVRNVHGLQQSGMKPAVATMPIVLSCGPAMRACRVIRAAALAHHGATAALARHAHQDTCYGRRILFSSLIQFCRMLAHSETAGELLWGAHDLPAQLVSGLEAAMLESCSPDADSGATEVSGWGAGVAMAAVPRAWLAGSLLYCVDMLLPR